MPIVSGRPRRGVWKASAISGGCIGAALFLGVPGMVMSSGFDALWYPACSIGGFLLLLLFIAEPMRRFGASDVADFATRRFDSPPLKRLVLVLVLAVGVLLALAEVKGAGTTLVFLFPGLPYWSGVALAGGVITIGVVWFGRKKLTFGQTFRYWLALFAILGPALLLTAAYGYYGTHLEANAPEPRLDLTGRRLLPRTNSVLERIDEMLRGQLSRWRLVKPVPMPDSGVSYHRDGFFTAGQVKETLEALFQANGVSPEPVGRKYFRAVKTAQSDSDQHVSDVQRREGWLSHHERPLALLSTYSLIIARVFGAAVLPFILGCFHELRSGNAAFRLPNHRHLNALQPEGRIPIPDQAQGPNARQTGLWTIISWRNPGRGV